MSGCKLYLALTECATSFNRWRANDVAHSVSARYSLHPLIASGHNAGVFQGSSTRLTCKTYRAYRALAAVQTIRAAKHLLVYFVIVCPSLDRKTRGVRALANLT